MKENATGSQHGGERRADRFNATLQGSLAFQESTTQQLESIQTNISSL